MCSTGRLHAARPARPKDAPRSCSTLRRLTSSGGSRAPTGNSDSRSRCSSSCTTGEASRRSTLRQYARPVGGVTSSAELTGGASAGSVSGFTLILWRGSSVRSAMAAAAVHGGREVTLGHPLGGPHLLVGRRMPGGVEQLVGRAQRLLGIAMAVEAPRHRQQLDLLD